MGDLFPCQSFGLIPDRFYTLHENIETVAIHQRTEAAIADAARGDLRTQIAETGFSETNIVGDDLENILIRLIAAVELERAKLQAFFINLPRAAEAEADAGAADIDPVRPHGEERHQLAAM